jgi:dsDNA-specific endonuclease/ATPase MutS2
VADAAWVTAPNTVTTTFSAGRWRTCDRSLRARVGASRCAVRRRRPRHANADATSAPCSASPLRVRSRAQAAEQLRLFLHDCATRHLRCVRIIHGKGLGSRNREPVLKNTLHKLLPRREDVVAFCQAPAAQGGGGALLVLLKKRL